MVRYLEFEFHVSPAVPGNEIVMAALSELAFESFVENEAGLVAYVEKDKFDGAAFDGMFLWELEDVKVSYSETEVEQKNWNEIWESNFQPIDVAGRCTIRAPFHPVPEKGVDIVIEPKMSFGTGHHETTRLMALALLDTSLRGKKVCDMGTGTGVLAVLAEKLGAEQVLAVDIDEWSYLNALENVNRNGCRNITVKMGGAEQADGEKFDVFLANINRNILLRDMARYVRAMNDGAVLLLSGFFMADVPVLLKEAEKYSLSYVGQQSDNYWTVLRLKKVNGNNRSVIRVLLQFLSSFVKEDRKLLVMQTHLITPAKKALEQSSRAFLQEFLKYESNGQKFFGSFLQERTETKLQWE